MNSFLSWIGGKKLLRERICNGFPEKYDKYVEVFGGAGWVLFNQERPGKTEIYNDYNSELVNLFRCMKYHQEELKRQLSYLLNSRELFQDFLAQYNVRGLTDIQRATRFFMILKTSYGSKMTTYGCVKRNVENMTGMFEEIQKRLNTVVIENLDFEKLIKQQDRENTFFFLDPPYFGTEKYYKNADFTKEDHERLYNIVKDVKGKFLISYNDCEYIRELYKDFKIEEVTRFSNLTAALDEKKEYKEILIKNY